MLSMNLLEAVLQGLSPIYLDDMGQAWQQFCMRIDHGMRAGHPPLEALKIALRQSPYPELRVIYADIRAANCVRLLRDLSFRQKELLVDIRNSALVKSLSLEADEAS